MTKALSERYLASLQQLARAESVIPLASQTFSKSRTQYPVGSAPLFADRAIGSRTWDIDGNEYVDLVSSLGAVVLGYGDPEITDAVTRQLSKGVSLSLSGELECIVAEKMVELIPCADSVRFGKNGTDATSAAIRLARAFTHRDHVIALGYHGWQDWYIGSTTRDLGVPEAVKGLTHRVAYDDLPALEQMLTELSGEIAAVILEPMTGAWPSEGYLESVRRLTTEHGIVLIFDEMLTGFRFAPGGAQQYFGVTPDLAAFGKGLANGFPLSAIVGRADIMALMEDIFFSGTFGGELLSLAAANVVLDRMATSDPTRELAHIGAELEHGVQALLERGGFDFLSTSGHPSWIFLNWHIDDPGTLAEAKTLFLQENLREGVLVLGTHDVTTAFKPDDINAVLRSYEAALSKVQIGLSTGTLRDQLECEPIVPLFKLR